MANHPTEDVGQILRDAARRAGRRGPRRTRRETAAEKLVDAIATLIDEGVESSDLVALEDARAVAERYRQN
jgi:hypothetical protein